MIYLITFFSTTNQHSIMPNLANDPSRKSWIEVPENSDFPIHFLDNEALFLHKEHYLKWVSKLLDFPVDYANPEIFKFITDDPNAKYVKYVDKYWLDEQVWHGVQSKQARGII